MPLGVWEFERVRWEGNDFPPLGNHLVVWPRPSMLLVVAGFYKNL